MKAKYSKGERVKLWNGKVADIRYVERMKILWFTRFRYSIKVYGTASFGACNYSIPTKIWQYNIRELS